MENGRLLVFGYLRTAHRARPTVNAWKRELAEAAVREDYALASVFTDNGVSDMTVIRPGFSALLDVLRLPTVYGVLLLASHHLSWRPLVFATLHRQVQLTGARVLIVAELTARRCARWQRLPMAERTGW
jgi:hypothetical protein